MSAADLENVRLSAQALLAIRLLLARRAGHAASDLAQTPSTPTRRICSSPSTASTAESPPRATLRWRKPSWPARKPQSTETRIARAQFEHAIAALTGQPPAALDIGDSKIAGPPPPIPLAVPSLLLERRPDIAANERLVAAANANVGIAETAYYPDADAFGERRPARHESGESFHLCQPQLVGRGGAFADPVRFRPPAAPTRRRTRRLRRDRGRLPADRAHRVSGGGRRSLDPALSGRRGGAAARGRGRRPTVAGLEIDRYRAGTVSYLNVITTQTIALDDQQNAITILQRRMNAAVDLVKALGGGWDASALPSGDELTQTSNAKRKT